MDRRKFRCKNCREWFRPNEREHHTVKTTRNYGGQELKAKEVYCCQKELDSIAEHLKRFYV